MSVADFRALGAIASQLVEALDSYEHDSMQLIESGPDSGLYSRVAECMDEIQRYGAVLPAVSVPAVALLISHAEFVYALWHHARTGNDDGRDMEVTVQEHRACIESLRRACTRQLRKDH